MIHARQLHKQYRMGDSIVHALAGVDLDVDAGEFVSITGASGSGKSTLMHILGCLDRPTAGTYSFRGQMISTLSEKQLAAIRNQDIGFVFQTFNLINRTSALENVVIPLVYTRRAYRRKTAMAALERVGLSQRAKHTPGEMSGGESQRVAIARAIVNSPSLIFADEPTGNLDSKTGQQIMQIFHDLHSSGITIILVTHEPDIAVQADRTIHMKDGLIIEDKRVDEHHRESVLSRTRDSQREMLRRKAAAQASPPHEVPS